MNAIILEVFHTYGYTALWVIIFVAAVGAPISGNLLLYAAGAFAAFGHFNILLLFLVAVSAAVMGDNLGYYIGRKAGTPLLIWLEKKKRLRFITPESIAQGRAYFRRRTGWAIFVTRFLIVVLGGPINWLAGAEHYNYRKFLFWDICGQILGAAIPLALGYIFAASWATINNLFGDFSGILVIALICIAITILVVRRLRASRTALAAEIITPSLAEKELATGETITASAASNTLPEEILPAAEHTPQSTEAEERIRPTILILISRSGGGHLNLAQALRETLSEHYNVIIADPQSKMVERSYSFFSRKFVKFLHWQYIWTDNKLGAWGLQNIIALMSLKRFIKVLEEFEPQLIITTHAMISYVTARANESQIKRVPLVFQLTDLECLHKTWFVEKYANAYLAPTREIFNQARQEGISQERLYITGRPVRQQFLATELSIRDETLISLGLDPAIFTIFLQGGAKGSAGVDQIIKSIQNHNLPIQIILATGNNTKIAERYVDIPGVKPLPFTENIAAYMNAADIIVGKAGASSITEAFILEKPFLVTTIIPGQETPSLQFIQRHNLGWVCLEKSAQIALLTKIVHNPALLAEKVRSIRDYKSWNIQANQTLQPIIDRLLAKTL